ncbi:PorP/SprF family type IX secretion system membrane protein [Phnomibacter ginsenosidimutans]|uniref:Type IX secretion system membrane protein PorP/SprF n=1 Tax=Phnomibacter ginsenosidimutans TaxID=2676868 RepID=A0A6I6GL90_9BACT|nr:PorP/SprF family type IX secretion system membrane protein [Phnomibacter ginsenosidimutans]QGW29225.1 type IX secretion system membrane protein PorP/SprF [Phnomibacter ginsenosidimutans]
MQRILQQIEKQRTAIVAVCCSVFSIGLLPHTAQAQDPHFSQFMNNPLLTNPANTGFNPDFDYRIGGSYRNQWWGLPVPYKTMSIWGDVQVMRDRFTNGWLGLGGVLLRDVAGSGNLTSTKAYGSIAWHQELGINSLLSAGFNIGIASKRIDIANFTWENQWNGKFFDANLTSGEAFAYSQIGYLDLQAGLNYAWFPSDKLYVNAGVSMLHLNNPRESFFNDALSNNRVPARYNSFINASIKLNDQWILNPNVYYSYQSGSSELVGGMMAQYNLGEYGEQQVIGGAYLRAGDAAIAMIGMQWKDVRLTVSYDATTSALKQFNNGNGALEFSLIKFGTFSGRTPRASRCPAF